MTIRFYKDNPHLTRIEYLEVIPLQDKIEFEIGDVNHDIKTTRLFSLDSSDVRDLITFLSKNLPPQYPEPDKNGTKMKTDEKKIAKLAEDIAEEIAQMSDETFKANADKVQEALCHTSKNLPPFLGDVSGQSKLLKAFLQWYDLSPEENVAKTHSALIRGFKDFNSR